MDQLYDKTTHQVPYIFQQSDISYSLMLCILSGESKRS